MEKKRNYFVAYKMGDEIGWSVITTEQQVTGPNALMEMQNYLRHLHFDKGVAEDKAMSLTITSFQRLENEEGPCLLTH